MNARPVLTTTPRPARIRHYPGVRGRDARLRLRGETEYRQRATLVRTTLPSGFRPQFLTETPCERPALHTLTGGRGRGAIPHPRECPSDLTDDPPP